MNEERLRRFLTLSLALFMGASLFYVCFRYVLPWCLPFLLALLVAALLEPVVLYLRRKFHFQRGFSALILTLTLLFLLGGLLSLLWSTLLSQTNALLAAAPAFFDAIPAAADDLLSRLEQFSASSPEWLSGYLHEQLFRAVTDADSLLRSLSSRAMAWLGSAAAALPGGVLAIATGVLAIFFTSASYPELCAALEHAVPEEAMAKLRLFRGGVMRSLARWLRAQATLSLITFSELLIGFLLMRQSYSLLLAFLITLLDALPVFGTGTALVPWAVFTLLFGFPPKAIVLLALYLCTLITRNTLEPKLLSAQAGLPPVASLFAMYLGYCTFGVAGWYSFPSSCCCSRRFETQKRKLPHKKENGENRSLFYCFLPACAAVVEQPVEELTVVSDIAGCAVSRRAGVVRRRLCAAVAASGGITARRRAAAVIRCIRVRRGLQRRCVRCAHAAVHQIAV
ncbi:sporulation integral membrane protein YtvI [Ruminococcaceae bacterium AF10-16]|nr:sporulation integral membrane protein YtvI [Ruminococcaceae bacterium AF10-16]